MRDPLVSVLAASQPSRECLRVTAPVISSSRRVQQRRARAAKVEQLYANLCRGLAFLEAGGGVFQTPPADKRGDGTAAGDVERLKEICNDFVGTYGKNWGGRGEGDERAAQEAAYRRLLAVSSTGTPYGGQVRGQVVPINLDRLSLPKPGGGMDVNRALSVSDWENWMLKEELPDAEQLQEINSYGDPRLRNVRSLGKLVAKLWKRGLLVPVIKRGNAGAEFFAVAKDSDSVQGEQRLIVDMRRVAAQFKEPPNCRLGSPKALSRLDLSGLVPGASERDNVLGHVSLQPGGTSEHSHTCTETGGAATAAVAAPTGTDHCTAGTARRVQGGALVHAHPGAGPDPPLPLGPEPEGYGKVVGDVDREDAHVSVCAFAGDVPCMFYNLLMPRSWAEWHWVAEASYEVCVDECVALGAARDEFLGYNGFGFRALPMGHKWSPYIAEECLEFALTAAGLGERDRILHGKCTPSVRLPCGAQPCSLGPTSVDADSELQASEEATNLQESCTPPKKPQTSEKAKIIQEAYCTEDNISEGIAATSTPASQPACHTCPIWMTFWEYASEAARSRLCSEHRQSSGCVGKP